MSSFLKESLVNAPDTSVKVSTDLHQSIMRAVRLAEPGDRKSSFFRSVPALGAGVLAILLTGVFLYQAPTEPVSRIPQAVAMQPPVQNPAEPLLVLGEEALVLVNEKHVPEQALREELERLKSDLARFDFRS